MIPAADLPDRWRERASELRTWAAAEGAALSLERCAAELEAALREARGALLSPAEAEAASGYSRRRLRELEADGRLQNYGRKGSPRYRRGDLPTKARAVDGFDAAAEARRLVAS